MSHPLRAAPTYSIASVDNALRAAVMLQLEGPLTVTDVAARLGVARSTAHRLLAMLVYRDFAVHDLGGAYRVGPVLELAAHSRSDIARLRERGLPHLRRLVDRLDETANLAIRAGDAVRFVASVESSQSLRISSREGMVFAAHRTTPGLVMLADLTTDQVEALYAAQRDHDHERPDLPALHAELARARRQGFAINRGRSERGVVAVGVPVRARDGEVVAGIAVSVPSVRYDKDRLPVLVAILRSTAEAIEHDL